MIFRRLDEKTFVAGQIEAADVEEAATHGVRLIVNNRPDGEEPGQPASAEIEAAAAAAGIDYVHIPVAGGFAEGQATAMREAMDLANGGVLAFCKSGTRSTYLWALARAEAGDDPEALIGHAAAAGYDLTPILPLLTR
jgi:uncharacterized protein (TIGR01244 family)